MNESDMASNMASNRYSHFQSEMKDKRTIDRPNVKLEAATVIRPPGKSAYWKTNFFISHPKHMLEVLKRTVSMRRFF